MPTIRWTEEQLTERSKRDWIASGQPNYRETAIQTQWNMSDFRTTVRPLLLLEGRRIHLMIYSRTKTYLKTMSPKALTKKGHLENPVTIG